MHLPKSPTAASSMGLLPDDLTSFKGLLGWRKFFLDQFYDDGVKTRQPGMLILGVGPEGWRWTLKDPTSKSCLRLVTPGHDEGIMILDALLLDPNACWVVDNYEMSKKAARRK